MKWLLRKAAGKHAGQLSVCSQSHSHHSLLFCRELHFPSASAPWLPDRFLPRETTWEIKGGKREETRIFSISFAFWGISSKVPALPSTFPAQGNRQPGCEFSCSQRRARPLGSANTTFSHCSCSVRGVGGFLVSF